MIGMQCDNDECNCTMIKVFQLMRHSMENLRHDSIETSQSTPFNFTLNILFITEYESEFV
jgi:hypothetical protein